ncbi:MAG: GIY-YIG nuclease family protein [Patescibacteria group bacterium]
MPSNTSSSVFFYVYVLESQKDGKRYIGYTNNLKQRLEEHNKGKSFSTKPRLPLKLIYFEGCLNEKDAKRREHYLKGTQAQYINFDPFNDNIFSMRKYVEVV